MNNDALMVFCTCPDEETAGRLAKSLVETRMAACVNVVPSIRSIYRWQDEIQEDSEVLLIIKTTQASYQALEGWLQEQHPYSIPEVVAVQPHDIAANYLAWLQGEIQGA